MQNQSNLGCYRIPDRGWDDIAQQIDLFLSRAILAIAAEYSNEPVEWLEINRWPDSGRLIVFPSNNLKGDRDERICCQLFSDYLQTEWERCAKSKAPSQEESWQMLSEKFWNAVRYSLTKGDAAQSLTLSRTKHQFRVAAYEYDFYEGLFRLLDLDSNASDEMKLELAAFKKQWQIP